MTLIYSKNFDGINYELQACPHCKILGWVENNNYHVADSDTTICCTNCKEIYNYDFDNTLLVSQDLMDLLPFNGMIAKLVDKDTISIINNDGTNTYSRFYVKDPFSDDEPLDQEPEAVDSLEPVEPEPVEQVKPKSKFNPMDLTISEKLDILIDLLSKDGISKRGRKPKTQGFDINEPFEIAEFKNPKFSIEINFTNRANTEYEVVKKDLLNLGFVEDFVDLVKKDLNPVVSKESPVYGIAKKIEPLNKTIQRAKDSIDSATSQLKDYQLKQQEAIIRAKLEAEAKAKAQTQDTPQGGEK